MADNQLILETGAAGGSITTRLPGKARVQNKPRPLNFSQGGPYFADLFALALTYLERRSTSGRKVFPVMLGIFVLAQIPALLGLTNTALWQAFASWFQALPLT
jgi:hypothetical protein